MARTPSQPRRILVRLMTLLGMLASLVVLASCTGMFEHTFVYFPDRRPFDTPPAYEDVRFQSADGTELHAWWIPAQSDELRDNQGRAPTVVHSHGNAGNISRHEEFVAWLAPEGFNVLLFDYRGYGRSGKQQGLRKRADFVADTVASIDAALARDDVDPDRVGMLGLSLGACMALNASVEREQVRCVVECAGFSTWQGVFSDYAGPLGPMMVGPGHDPADAASRLGDRPLLIVHGKRDGVVRYRHAGIIEAAARRAGVDVEVHTEPGSDHVTLLTDWPDSRSVIAGFLGRHLAPSGPVSPAESLPAP